MLRLSNARELVLRLVILSGLIFTPLLSFHSWASAQGASAPAWVVRTLKTSEFGVSAPKGLAFSPRARALLLLDGTSNLSLVSMDANAVGSLSLPDVQADPLNVAFDQKSGGLYVFNRSKSEIVKLAADGAGVPKSVGSSRFAGQALGVGEAQGITFDPASGIMFILDAGKSQILSVAPDAAMGFDGAQAVGSGKVKRISLKKLGAGVLRGLAFNPGNGHLYVASPAQKELYELDLNGNLIATFDLQALGINDPSSMTFAPSVDNTDDPSIHDLFILDAGAAAATAQSGLAARLIPAKQAAASGPAQIVEVSLITPAALPSGTPLLPATLVRTFDTSNAAWNPSSPDPAGIAYWPLTGGLLIADSEVDEMPNYFTGKNMFESTLTGSLVKTCSTINFTQEPTGVAINPNNNHVFISQDGANSKLFEISLGPDGTYCTADDTQTTTLLSTLYGMSDAEDVAYGNNSVFIADGVNAEVYVIPLGPNGVLGGGDDGAMTHFDTLSLGFTNVEGIEYNSDSGTLFIISSKGAEKYVGETTITGTLLRAYDLTLMGAGGNIRSGMTYARSSGNAAVKSIYIVSRGVDNNTDPNENDGKVWEIFISPPTTPTPVFTATRTPTTGPSPTNTRTPTAGPSPTFTRTPTITPTAPSSTSVCLGAVQDSHIIQDSATQNQGTSSDLRIKPDSGKERRILIRFDLASIPQSSTVLSSTLRLYEDTKKDGQTITLYRLTSSWVETQVTWNNRASGTPWTTPGGVFDAAALATFSPNIDKQYREINVLGVTQSWVNGSQPNNGILLRSTGANGEVRFKSREASSTQRPQLCVTYRLPSTSTPAPTATNMATNTPVPTLTSTAVLTNTPLPTNTLAPTNTSVPAATTTASNTPLPGATNTPVAGTPTNPPVPSATPTLSQLPDLIFVDGFESGGFAAWTSSKTDLGDLSVSTAAALVGTNGMQAVIDDTVTIYVTDDTPNAEPRYRARFYFDANSLTMASGDTHVIFNGFSGTSTTTGVLRIEFRNSSGAYQVRARSFSDVSAWSNTGWFTISDAPHTLEVDWRAATADGANNGGLTFWIDGVQQADLTGIDNDTRRIDSVRLGAVVELDPGTLGTYYFDGFESRRQTYIGP